VTAHLVGKSPEGSRRPGGETRALARRLKGCLVAAALVGWPRFLSSSGDRWCPLSSATCRLRVYPPCTGELWCSATGDRSGWPGHTARLIKALAVVLVRAKQPAEPVGPQRCRRSLAVTLARRLGHARS
jgi:hypothetical protein